MRSVRTGWSSLGWATSARLVSVTGSVVCGVSANMLEPNEDLLAIQPLQGFAGMTDDGILRFRVCPAGGRWLVKAWNYQYGGWPDLSLVESEAGHVEDSADAAKSWLTRRIREVYPDYGAQDLRWLPVSCD